MLRVSIASLRSHIDHLTSWQYDVRNVTIRVFWNQETDSIEEEAPQWTFKKTYLEAFYGLNFDIYCMMQWHEMTQNMTSILINLLSEHMLTWWSTKCTVPSGWLLVVVKKIKDSNILLNHLLIPNPDMCTFQLPSNDYLALIRCEYPDYCYNLAYVAHFIAYHT